MPLVYQQNINATTKIAVWHITETEDFFLKRVSLQREIGNSNQRLQYLAGRFLLKELYPDFPVNLIQIADTNKPFLEKDLFNFSISHSGDYATALVSITLRVGVDVELLNRQIERIQHKFMYAEEVEMLNKQCTMPINQALTLYWSVKESVFKWWAKGAVDFKDDVVIKLITGLPESGIVHCDFKNKYKLDVQYLFFNNHVLTWVLTDH